MELRYVGFDQLGGARAFRFEIQTEGASTRQAVVTAEMGLFLQHQVAIQDGPSLCARKLAADLENHAEGEHALTSDDLRAYRESQAAAEAKRQETGGRRGHKGPTVEDGHGA